MEVGSKLLTAIAMLTKVIIGDFMKKRIKEVVIILLSLMILHSSSSVNAADYNDYGWYKNEINNCDIDIKVEDNNILRITENYQVHFNEEVHGLYRIIPLNSRIKRSDGSSYILRAKISDIEVEDKPFTCSRGISDEEIKIGDEDELIEGDQEYTISYTYNLGNDRSRNFDEFYFNLIGSEWEDTIFKNVTFKITMPKDFNEDKIGFTAGKVDNINGADVYYEVNDNVITGEYSTPLTDGEALTIRVELPQGYFKYNSSYMIISIITSMIITIMTLVVVFKRATRGKKIQPIEPVLFYPPYGANPIQIKKFYNKSFINTSDISILLIYLANKGYIKIVEEKSNEKIEYVFTKLREYNGSNKIEELFMEKFFENKDVIKGWFVGINLNNAHVAIRRQLRKESKESPVYTEKSVKSLKIGWILALISSILGITMLCYNSGITIGSGIKCGVGVTTAIVIMLYFVIGKEKYKRKSGWGNLAIISVSVVIAAVLLYKLLYFDEANILLGIVCIIAGIIDTYCIVGMRIRTEFSNKIYGEICGFKNFLEVAEKDRLEALVMQNPNYFFDILPYTYVLEVSDKWIKSFANIVTMQPNWCTSNFRSNTWDVNTCVSSIDNLVTKYVKSITSTASSGGSRSGGGGRSGGGAGGGGGGSW